MSQKRKICVTGATGFIGQALCAKLLEYGHSVRAVTRHQNSILPNLVDSIETLEIKEVGVTTDWSAALTDVDCVIHCAARAHVIQEKAEDALAAYHAVNVAGTKNLVEQAAVLGVRRLVFLSSIGVLGIHTNDREPFTILDEPHPVEDYSISKLEAENILVDISTRTGLDVVIIRPPLVYGASAKGNFLRLLRLVAGGVPMPLGYIKNQRSLVGIDNLVDLIITCIKHPAAANQTFLVSDDEDISTTELLQRMGKALGKPARLIPVSPKLLEFGARLLGKQDVARRLLGNLQVDISKTKELLGWVPPVSVDEGLRKTAEWYLQQQ